MTGRDVPAVDGLVQVPVLCALRGALEGDVVRLLAGAADAVTVTRRCADVAELLAEAAAGLGRVAVVSSDLDGLDRIVVGALRAHGVEVVGVEVAEKATGRLVALGVHDVLGPHEVGPRLLDLVVALAEDARQRDVRVPSPTGAGGAVGVWCVPEEPGAVWSVDEDPGRSAAPGDLGTGPGAHVGAQRSTVVAVWGPTGAPGRSTVALNLAAELTLAEPGPGTSRRTRARRASAQASASPAAARRDGPVAGHTLDDVLLVDADTYSGVLGQLLGLLDDASGLAAACRAAAVGTLSAEAFARLVPAVGPRLGLLSGIARASRWPELAPDVLDVVWERCRAAARWTVVDCGFNLEHDEALSYDTRAPQRNGATLSALAEADVLVVVGSADPVGLTRLVRALDELGETEVDAARLVVVNRLRPGAAGAHPRAAVEDALLRYAGVSDVLVVPEDQAAVDSAVLAGRTLAEHAPTSAARLAVRDLARRVRASAVPASAPPRSPAPTWAGAPDVDGAWQSTHGPDAVAH